VRLGFAQAATLAFLGVMLFACLRLLTSYEDTVFWRHALIRRDHVATVIASGEGMDKRLYVNGIGLTYLTPVTKVMVHVPLAALKEKPESALVICFGMGTTFRSASRWNIDVTGVELVPSVPEVFGYYHADSHEVLAQPNVRVVVDDGRRYLKRVERTYDLITIDPPPPIEAAGSSLLYSVEFYELAKQRLKEGGILAQWLLGGEQESLQAAIRSICSVFPHVRAFILKDQGIHLFASMKPVELPTPDEFVRRLPEPALRDFVEWQPVKDPRAFYETILACEAGIDELLAPDPSLIIRDNRPFNEYFLVRRAARLLQDR
jgi:spermidine synthase